MMSATSRPTTLPSLKALHTGSGEPLLLLHGFVMSPRCWEPTAARRSDTSTAGADRAHDEQPRAPGE